ncbi:MAG: YHS domain-containing protein [Candidatus Hydrothermarchaeaceae archaeon]
MAIDPICKMTVDEDTAKYKTEYEGTTYYFCAPGCKSAFEENPGKYLGEESGSTEMHRHEHRHSGDKKPWWKFW